MWVRIPLGAPNFVNALMSQALYSMHGETMQLTKEKYMKFIATLIAAVFATSVYAVDAPKKAEAKPAAAAKSDAKAPAKGDAKPAAKKDDAAKK